MWVKLMWLKFECRDDNKDVRVRERKRNKKQKKCMNGMISEMK